MILTTITVALILISLVFITNWIYARHFSYMKDTDCKSLDDKSLDDK